MKVSIGMHRLRQQKNCLHQIKAVIDLEHCKQNQHPTNKNISLIDQHQINFLEIS